MERLLILINHIKNFSLTHYTYDSFNRECDEYDILPVVDSKQQLNIKQLNCNPSNVFSYYNHSDNELLWNVKSNGYHTDVFIEKFKSVGSKCFFVVYQSPDIFYDVPLIETRELIAPQLPLVHYINISIITTNNMFIYTLIKYYFSIIK